MVLGGMHGGRGCVWWGVCMVAGGHAWWQGGTCVVAGGHAWWGDAWQGGVRGIGRDMVNKWAVRILLECILVFTKFTNELYHNERKIEALPVDDKDCPN